MRTTVSTLPTGKTSGQPSDRHHTDLERPVMATQQQLDQQALAAAQRAMGEVAWPTILLGVLVFPAYLATIDRQSSQRPQS